MHEVRHRFRDAVEELDKLFAADPSRLADDRTEAELREWLGDLPWAGEGVTADEWFFITTLYGEMTLAGQRSHIRRFFQPLFVDQAGRDIRNFTPELTGYAGLRSGWMKSRLCRMGAVLRKQELSMAEYADQLRAQERAATPDDPTPALETIKRDHQASGWKTLSCFVRDCVQGNSFPIDSRVAAVLSRWKLPTDELQLVVMSLELNRNPREVARMFYASGG